MIGHDTADMGGAVPSADPSQRAARRVEPERMCAVTRAVRDASQLIRFVAGPDGQVVPDIDHKLPGRGVWLTCNKEIVEKAIKIKAFSRALKASAVADAGLSERVGALLRRKALETLALANKSGLVVSGFQKVDTVVANGKAAVLVGAADAAADGRGKLERKFHAVQASKGRTTVVITNLSNDEISLAIGRAGVVHAALTPGGLTDRFEREARRVALYEASGSKLGDENQSQAPATLPGGTDNG